MDDALNGRTISGPPLKRPRLSPKRSDRPAILLVDDDDQLRSDLSDWLASGGFEVIGVADHHEALRVVESGRRLDLLMADIVLRNGISGLTTCRLAQLRRPELRVLYITAYDLPREAAVGIPVLRKPLIPALMAEQIERLID